MDNKKPKLRERALFLLNPEAGQRAFSARLKREREAAKESGAAHSTQMAATGYGNHGASTTLNSMIGWLVGGGSAEDDSDLHGALLRLRSRDLYAGGGLARSAVDVLVNNVIAWGIRPKPSIDAEALGMSEEACDEWERNTLREFRLWAENAMCDAERQENFYGLQQLAFRSMLVSGDSFALFGMRENPRTPYQTTLRILEADRVSTPEGSPGESESTETAGGGRIVDGVEIDKEGMVIRYHIANRHPLLESSSADIEWKPIDAFGKDTGFPNILHIMMRERPEQRRGVPLVACVIEQIKQLDRYITAELAANIVASLFALFLTSENDDSMMGFEDAVNEEDKVTDDELHVELAPGIVIDLPPGKKVADVNPGRANTAFGPFVEAMQTTIGASMNIPKEVLTQKYESNYTAARGAKLDFWRLVTIYRHDFNDSFNQPVYEMWLSEAVAAGRIEAPGFFDDPMLRQAWCGCTWMGASMGHIDPLKEVNAAAKRIELNISTEEQEAAEYNGNDWRANIRQRKAEKAAFDDMKEGEGNAE
ncbi:MAG: phage portal protein [Clostridia bacterium]|nr:phage portal protein [Clostridia bacterium]